jgi:hypothetical protein
MATITDDLKLVLPVRGDKEATVVHAYHTPISRAVFEANYRILAGTRASMLAKGTAYMMDAGPRIAALALADEGKRDAADQGEKGDGGATALLGELRRLTTILAPGQGGWEMLPVDAAIAQGAIDAEEWDEVASALVFFTCVYAMARKSEKARVASVTALTLGGEITSSSATAFADSLPTLTKAEASVLKAGSSVPS